MLRTFCTVSISMIMLCSWAQVELDLGDTELEASLDEININAEADFGIFSADMSATYDISEGEIEDLSVTVGMEPAEIWLTLEIADILDITVGDVVEVYEVNKDAGWGVIARELGIKPGSEAFHALKDKAKDKSNKSNSGNGKGKNK